MELSIKTIRVYGKSCIGCIRKNKRVMLSFMHAGDKEQVHDLFLTTRQAMELHKELAHTLSANASRPNQKGGK